MSRFALLEKQFHWEEGSVKDLEDLGSSFEFYVEFFSPLSGCPFCHHETIHIKDCREQKGLLGYEDAKPVYAVIHKRRFVRPCCRKTFYEEIPGVGRYQRRSSDIMDRSILSCFGLMDQNAAGSQGKPKSAERP